MSMSMSMRSMVGATVFDVLAEDACCTKCMHVSTRFM
jgi:hypothetical protein